MVTGVVLAGGRSSRMGRDKAFLTIKSKTLIEIVIERLRPCVDRVMVVGSARNLVQLRRLPVDAVLTDCHADQGPLMGIYTALMQTETPLNLCVPCDMPWIDGRLLERLIDAVHGEAELVASLHPQEGVQPFPLVCHARACRAIGALLDRGERSLQALVLHPKMLLVTIEQSELWPSFTNVNTIADYVKVCDETTLPSRS